MFLPKQTCSLITIHDLLPFKPNNRFSFVQRLYLTQLTKLCAHKARTIVTVSNTSKKDIVNTLGVSADKVEVTYNITNKPILNEISCNAELPSNYFFSIGALQKDKQYDVVIRGFYLFLTTVQSDYKLLIAGGDQGHRNELESLVLELGISNKVVFLGYIDESDKWIYIKNCIATILMGKNEGFGIPVIESILLHKPAIVANLGALPEIVGKGGYVIESDKESVAEAFELCTSIDTCIESEVFDREIKRFQLSEQLNVLIHALKCSLK
jgi:glycosyltransferase involved in cell wall biosynthesis